MAGPPGEDMIMVNKRYVFPLLQTVLMVLRANPPSRPGAKPPPELLCLLLVLTLVIRDYDRSQEPPPRELINLLVILVEVLDAYNYQPQTLQKHKQPLLTHREVYNFVPEQETTYELSMEGIIVISLSVVLLLSFLGIFILLQVGLRIMKTIKLYVEYK